MQQELEKLNACTEEINLLETQLEDANCLFRCCDRHCRVGEVPFGKYAQTDIVADRE